MGPALVLLAGLAAAPTCAARVELVQLEVQVTRDGRALEGLTAGDFEVTDNGVAQHPRLVGRGDLPLDVVLAVDTSSSLEGRPLGHLQDAARTFLSALSPEDRLALVTFAERPALRADYGANRQAVAAVIGGMQASGSTALWDAVWAALGLAAPGARRPLLLVFSDGLDRLSWLGPEDVRRRARRSPAVIYAVQPATDPRAAPPGDLAALAEESGGRVFRAADPADVRRAFLGVLADTRSNYVLSYAPEGVAPAGRHRIRVRLAGQRGEVRCRQWYERTGP